MSWKEQANPSPLNPAQFHKQNDPGSTEPGYSFLHVIAKPVRRLAVAIRIFAGD